MKISKQWKKGLEILFYTKVPKIMIICYTVPETWHVSDVIVIFHFGQFLACLPPKQPQKWKFHKKVCDGCNCHFSFWAIFCSFNPLIARKMNISKQWKKRLEIRSFYTSVPKIMICYTVPKIWCVRGVIVIFYFRLFFALLPL